VSRCAVSSIRHFATTILDFALPAASEPAASLYHQPAAPRPGN
jgi:hypothetical protein